MKAIARTFEEGFARGYEQGKQDGVYKSFSIFTAALLNVSDKVTTFDDGAINGIIKEAERIGGEVIKEKDKEWYENLNQRLEDKGIDLKVTVEDDG